MALLPHVRIPPNTVNVKVHYSFNMAQQVHYPSDPLQPGPMYFLIPWKCTIFGVYLTDEAADTGRCATGKGATGKGATGKGATGKGTTGKGTTGKGTTGKGTNSIISRLHHFLPVTLWGNSMY